MIEELKKKHSSEVQSMRHQILSLIGVNTELKRKQNVSLSKDLETLKQ